MKTIADLQAIREQAKYDVEVRKERDGYKITVGMGTCGIAAGARAVMTAVLHRVQEDNLHHVIVTQTGCMGKCDQEPIVEVLSPCGEKTVYVKMDTEKAKEIVDKHVLDGKPVTEYTL